MRLDASWLQLMMPAQSEPIECGTIERGSRPWFNQYAGEVPVPALDRVTFILTRFLIQVGTAPK